MGFNYNSKLKSPELLKLNGKVSLIRFKETFHDLFSNCIVNNTKNDNSEDVLLLMAIIISVILCFIIFWTIIFLFF